MHDHTTLTAWQAAREICLSSTALARDHWKPWAAAIFDQLQRASLSVQLNLAEGYAVRTQGRTRQHWLTAYGSCVETADCLNLLLSLDAAPVDHLRTTLARTREAQAMLLGLLRHLNKGRRPR